VSNISFQGINEQFPVAGQDNDTQVFRDNFDSIKQALRVANEEISDLQDNTARTDDDVDYNLKKIRNAVLENVRDQKLLGFDGTNVNVSPTTVDFQLGHYQIFKVGSGTGTDPFIIDFINFPGDPALFGSAGIGVGKVILELYSDGQERSVAFRTSGTTLIKKNNFPLMPDGNIGDVIVRSDSDPVLVEVWRWGVNSIYIKYLGFLDTANTESFASGIGSAGSLLVKGTVAVFEDLPVDPNPGDAYVVRDPAPARIYIWEGAVWIDLGEIQGPQGPRGFLGLQGTQGPQGTQGFQGTQGTQGTQGLDGLFAGQGIQGIQGAQGAQGAQGTFGAQGAQGTQGIQGVDGLFAGQGIQGRQGTQGILGNQGIQGTEGEQGIQGFQGTQGIQGRQGALGNQGTQGIQGLQSPQGIQGNFGTQGAQGIQGIQSTQGIQGSQGRQGTQGTQGILGNQGIQGTQGPQGTQGIQGRQGIQGITPTDISDSTAVGGGVITMDLSRDLLTVTLTGNVTNITYINTPAAGTIQRTLLIVTQDGVGNRTIATSGFLYPGNPGTVPITATANATSILEFVAYNGTVYVAHILGANYG
jgi:hypothetical protein